MTQKLKWEWEFIKEYLMLKYFKWFMRISYKSQNIKFDFSTFTFNGWLDSLPLYSNATADIFAKQFLYLMAVNEHSLVINHNHNVCCY